MQVRLSTKDNLPQIIKIVDEAKRYLKSQGIDQWQNGYPNEDSFQVDIENKVNYVLINGQNVYGTASIIPGLEPTYLKIDNGSWLTDGPYVTIHRIAIKDGYKGQHLSKYFFDYANKLAGSLSFASIRIDTHPDNKAMIHLLSDLKFQKTGTIYLENGDLRIAYEQVLNSIHR